MHNGFVVEVKELKPHSNADKLQLATFYGETAIVDLSVKIGDIGVYFPCDLQLSEEFCEKNNLVRKKDENGNNIGGFLDPDKRNIKALKLRGEKSYGLYMPIHSFDYCYEGGTELAVNMVSIGDQITVLNGHEICTKYIPRSNKRAYSGCKANKTRKHTALIAPLFKEHADTEQLAYNLADFKPGDEVEITLKMHGTSQRTGYLPTIQGYADSWPCRVGNILRHGMKRMGWYNGEDIHNGEPIYDYGYISGTRRVVLENYEGGFYGDNSFREPHSKIFEGKLWKGETAYYEVVSFTSDGTPIMGKGKVPEEAQAQYGKEMVFHYGLETGSDLYLYRMTFTSTEGYIIEYTPDLLRLRAEQIGVKTVPLFEKFIIPTDIQDAGSYVLAKAEQYYDGPDPIGKTHIREGVVVRIVNRPSFCAYKHKNFLFKQISGIITEQIANTSNYTEDILTEL